MSPAPQAREDELVLEVKQQLQHPEALLEGAAVPGGKQEVAPVQAAGVDARGPEGDGQTSPSEAGSGPNVADERRGWPSFVPVTVVVFLELILDLMSERAVWVTAASTACGVLLGCLIGSGIGCLAGAVFGAALGIIPALFTFGLSVPVGAVLFGAVGLCLGCCLGALIGGLVVGLLGYAVHTGWTISRLAWMVHDTVFSGLIAARGHVVKSWTGVHEVGLRSWTDPAVRFAAASAIAGAGTFGVAGGGTGAVVGGAIGGTVGVVPAIFTFGLSIPVLALVGAGCGLVLGTAAGGTAGFFGGGTLGYVANRRRGCTRGVAGDAWARAAPVASAAKEQAATCEATSPLTQRSSDRRTRASALSTIHAD